MYYAATTTEESGDMRPSAPVASTREVHLQKSATHDECTIVGLSKTAIRSWT